MKFLTRLEFPTKTFITYLEITLVVLFLITLGYFIFNKNNNNVDTHKNQIDSLNTDISKLNKKIDSIKLTIPWKHITT